MSAANQDRMRAAFNLFDPDGDGKITQEGLKNTLKTLGKDATDAELRSLIGGDVSGLFTARDGKIDYETFCKIYTGEIKQDKEQITDLQTAFQLLDADGVGYITAVQLKAICKYLGEDLTIGEVRAPRALRRRRARARAPTHSLCPSALPLSIPLARARAPASASPPTRAPPTRTRLDAPQVDEMVSEALIGYDKKIYYDGLLKILITQ